MFDQLASDETLNNVVIALQKNGIDASIVENGEAAKQKVIEMIPKGAEVMTMTSVTLDQIGITQIINESGDYDLVKEKLAKMDRATQGLEMQKLGAAPEWAIASVHAVTEEGQVFIASNTGSQLPASVYGSPHVIWVVGAQKVVKDFDMAMKRIYEYVLPLEAERARKAYGAPGSNVSKLLMVNKEVVEGRIIVILVKEKLGY